jgi:hypothetical protein
MAWRCLALTGDCTPHTVSFALSFLHPEAEARFWAGYFHGFPSRNSPDICATRLRRVANRVIGEDGAADVEAR